MRVGAIDVGTNSILLLVAEERDGGLVAVDDRCRIERLGRGVDVTRRLDPAKVAGALDAMREYAAALAGCDRVRAVGTQALREAENAEDFLGPAQAILGVPVEVIDGEREADLSFLAVARSFPGLGPVVVCDVGGGSTELVVGEGDRRTSAVSVPIGSVRLTERHLRGDPPTEEERAQLIAALDEALAPHALPEGATVVGVAGTVTSLASVALALDSYDGDRVHGMRLATDEVERQMRIYLSTPLAERQRMVGLDPKRADVIGAGCAIVARVLAKMGADELVVSDRGVRWGLAWEALG